jgi:serine/threonine-protein kinase
MGTVWVARHTELGAPVAVKFIDPELTSSEELRLRFEREAKASASIQSPHVVQMHDYGVDDGVPFLAMELLHGEDLSVRIVRDGRIPVAAAARVVVQTCKALRRAHALGIVHRDLKPENIFLVADEDEEIVVKLLDFGIAKTTSPGMLESRTTSARAVFGSPAYMSPEQATGAANADHRSDLWSVAIVAYEMLTGELPFVGESAVEIMASILRDPVRPATRLEPSLPPAIDAFFERALSRDAAERYQSARDLSRAFSKACGMNEALPDSQSTSGLASVVRDAPPLDERPARRGAEGAQTAAPGTIDVTVPPSPRRRWALVGLGALGAGSVVFALLRSDAPPAEPAPAAPPTATPAATSSHPPTGTVESTAAPAAPTSAAAPTATVEPSASAAPPPAPPQRRWQPPRREKRSDELGF